MRRSQILDLVLQFICLFIFIYKAVKGIQVDALIAVLLVVNTILLQGYILLNDED